MGGLKCDQSARMIICGHALMQNIRCGHYELGVASAFTEVARTIDRETERKLGPATG